MAVSGSSLPHGDEKAEYRTLIPTKQRILEESGATVLYNTTVHRAYLKAHQPDVVVLATGAAYQKRCHLARALHTSTLCKVTMCS